MVSWQTPLALLAAALLAGDVEAFFRINCGKLIESRIDPIVSPGKVSGHLHTIVGGSNVGYNSTYQDLVNSECTSCEITKDKSAYWTPELFYQFPNGTFTTVPHGGVIVYYLGRGTLYNGTVKYTPFPHGFRMLSGNAGARSYDNMTLALASNDHASRPIADRVSWLCITDPAQAETPGFQQQTNCPGGLRAQLHFQSCWNGVDLYKADNSHVAYLSQIDNGICPPGYDYLLPHIFLETYYSITDPMFNSGGRMVLSMGDPTGFGYHGDFFNGWDDTVLQGAIDNCLSDVNSFGTIEECPILLANDNTNTDWQCPHKDPVVDESIYGLLPKLPGCIKVVNGPAAAAASDMSCPSTVTPPKIFQTTMSTPITTVVPQANESFGRTSWNYVGCSTDVYPNRVLSAWSYEDDTGLTIEACQTYCQSHGQKYAGVEYGRQCFCDNAINKANFSAGNACDFRCAGDATRNCGGSSTIEIFDNAAAVSPPTPSVLAKSGTYLSKGCYKDTAQSGGVRTLAEATMSSSSMNVDVCVKFCLGKNLRYAGVSYGNECYCAANMNNGATPAPASDCNMYCAGNNNNTAQMCGGSWRLNVYYSKNVISISKRWLGRGLLPWSKKEVEEEDEEDDGFGDHDKVYRLW